MYAELVEKVRASQPGIEPNVAWRTYDLYQERREIDGKRVIAASGGRVRPVPAFELD